MKIRSDYVTNSSSSSFIIDKNNISREELKKMLVEMANADRYWNSDYHFTEDDFAYENGYEYISNFIIKEATEEQPYHTWDEWDIDKKEETNQIYSNHYIIDNDSCCRYDWGIVEDILNKYHLELIYGYCD